MFQAPARIGASALAPWWRIAMAMLVAAVLIGNWLAPIGIRLQWRSFDAPVLFLLLLLLSLWAFSAAAAIASRRGRYMGRGLSALSLAFAIPPAVAAFVLPVTAEPVAVATVGSDQVVASLMAGAAMGPHYTEFRQERRIVTGLLLARYLGSSDYIGDVTMSFTPPYSLRAVVTPFDASNALFSRSNSPDVVDLRVPPLPSWWWQRARLTIVGGVRDAR
jgi:energy-coupling factor transporter transmembrane protein EcfT